MKKSLNWKVLLISAAVPLLTGGLSALLSGGFSRYSALRQPPLAPPEWFFPVVWSILFLLMGIGSFLVWKTPASARRTRSLVLYAVQLAVNFLWPILFFRFGLFWPALIELLLLWILVLVMIGRFAELSRAAAWLQLPYLLWLTFAAYLNFGIWFLNG